MSIPYEIIIARMQPQKQLLLPYLIARTSVSNLILNEEFSLVVVFGLLPILFLMSTHFLLPSRLDEVFDFSYYSLEIKVGIPVNSSVPDRQIGKAKTLLIFFRLHIS